MGLVVLILNMIGTSPLLISLIVDWGRSPGTGLKLMWVTGSSVTNLRQSFVC